MDDDDEKNLYFSGNTNSFNVSNSYNAGSTLRRDGNPAGSIHTPPGFPFHAGFPFPTGFPFSTGLDPSTVWGHSDGTSTPSSGNTGVQPSMTTQNIINGVLVPGGQSSAAQPEWKLNVPIGNGTFGAVFLEQVEVNRHGATEFELWAVKRIPKGVQSFPADRYMEEISLLGALKQVCEWKPYRKLWLGDQEPLRPYF